MQGHAAANVMPVLASNRVGKEVAPDGTIVSFYGHSFVTDETGAIIAELTLDDGVATETLDLDRARMDRATWGLFRDRRPDLYGRLAQR